MGGTNNEPIKNQSWFARNRLGRYVAWCWWKLIHILQWSILVVAVITSLYFGFKEWLHHGGGTPTPGGFFEWCDTFLKTHLNFEFDNSHFIDVFIGSCGVLIGVIVTILVDRKNTADSEHIRTTTKRILEKVEDAVTFSTITEYEKLLDEIDKVIKDANDRHHDLFIINPTASFGYFMTFDADVVISSTHNEAQRHISPIMKLRQRYFSKNTAQQFYGD